MDYLKQTNNKIHQAMLSNTSKIKLQESASNGLRAINTITTSCQGVVNTHLSIPKTEPQWYKGLDKNLTIAKDDANYWLTHTSGQVTKEITDKILSFVPLYKETSKVINNIALENPNAKGKSNTNVKDAQSKITNLLVEMDVMLDDIDKTSYNLYKSSVRIKSDYNALTNGAFTIEDAQKAYNSNAEQMNFAIQVLNKDIRKESIAKIASIGAVSLGFLMLALGVYIAPETNGLSLLIAAIFGIAVIRGTGTWINLNGMITEQSSVIAEHKTQLDFDNTQLDALQLLADMSNQAIASLKNASRAFNDYETTWQRYKAEIQVISEELIEDDYTLGEYVEKYWSKQDLTKWTDLKLFIEEQVANNVGGPTSTELAETVETPKTSIMDRLKLSFLELTGNTYNPVN